jgi:hypothetical protein
MINIILPTIALIIALYNVEDAGELAVFSGLSICFLPVIYFTQPIMFTTLLICFFTFVFGGIIGVIKHKKKQSAK